MVSEGVIATIHPGLLAAAKQLAGAQGEDLLQDAYEQLVKTGPRFSEVDGPGRVAKWMRIALRNVWYRRLRARQLEPDVEDLAMAVLPVADNHGAQLFELE